MQAEPFLELFVPDAACLECSCCGGLLSIDVVLLADFVGPNMMVEGTEAPELSMELDTLTLSFQHHLWGSLAVVLGQLLCSAVWLFLLLVS